MAKFYLFFISTILYCHCVEFPPNWQKCSVKDPNFSKCLVESTEKVLKMLEKPIPGLGLPSLNPLEMPERIKLSGGKKIVMDLEYWNLKFLGYQNAKIQNFIIDFNTKEINFDYLLDKFYVEANFLFDGTMFGEVINATGKKKITYINMLNKMTANFNEYEQNGKTHMKVNGKDNNVKIETITYEFECEDKAVGEHLTKLYNDHYYTILEDIDYVYDLYYLTLFVDIFNRVLAIVPMSEIFDGI